MLPHPSDKSSSCTYNDMSGIQAKPKDLLEIHPPPPLQRKKTHGHYRTPSRNVQHVHVQHKTRRFGLTDTHSSGDVLYASPTSITYGTFIHTHHTVILDYFHSQHYFTRTDMRNAHTSRQTGHRVHNCCLQLKQSPLTRLFIGAFYTSLTEECNHWSRNVSTECLRDSHVAHLNVTPTAWKRAQRSSRCSF